MRFKANFRPSTVLIWGSLVLAYGPGLAGCKTSDFNATSGSSSSSAGYSMLPPSFTLVVGESKTFTSSGGTAPYAFSISTNLSGGTIDANGVYTAGPTSGVTDTLLVTDANGRAASATAIVKAALTVTAPTTPVMVTDSQTIVAAGGVPPYSFSLTLNPSTGSI